MRHAGLITACLLALDASMAWARVAAPQHVLLAADSPVSDVWPTAHMPIALTDTPATRLFLQADFFNFVAQASVAVLKQLEGTRLPDVRTDTPVPVIGAVHLTLSAMEIHRVEASPADAHMSVTDDRRFDLRIANVTIGFRGKWRWVKGVLNSGGTFEVRAVSSSIAAGVTLQANETTVFPNVRVLDARVSFGELRVVVSDSSLKWLYDVLKGVFSGAIRDVAQAELGKALRETLPAEANRYVAQLPQSIALWKGTHVRYGVVGEPEISARGLVLGDAFGVEVHAKDGSVSGCPLVPATPRTPDPFTNDKMVQLHVRDDVFSCVMWGLHAEGFFHRYFHINFTVPDRGNTTDDHTAALTASLRRAIAPASAIGATLEVSLPKGAPTLTLLTNKTFQFTVHDLAIKAVVHSAVSEYPSIRNAKPPLEVRFNFQLDLFFRLEVDGYGNGARGRVVKMRLDGEDAENNVDVIDFADERLRSSVDMFAAATEAVRLWAAYTQRDIADMMSRIPRTFASALLLPVPIALPWPFSDVSIKDFGFHVLPHMFEVEGQLALEV